jgi:predicted MFS family arabinose efflux permease
MSGAVLPPYLFWRWILTLAVCRFSFIISEFIISGALKTSKKKGSGHY